MSAEGINKKLLLINSAINSGSTGRIAEEIGREASAQGFDVTAAYGFTNNQSVHNSIEVGGTLDHYLHALLTRITDRHGYGSTKATRTLVNKLKENTPDVVNLHNIHGYYLNIEVLMGYLASINKPVVWTLHDCWPFTGHCSYFDAVNCDRWVDGCHDCPNKKGYPASFLVDNSRKNFAGKKALFRSLPNLTIVAPCQWMADNVKRSFLSDYRTEVIYNGVDTNVFTPASEQDTIELKRKLGLSDSKIILGVASTWDKRKGLEDFIKMASMLRDDERIVLIGLNDAQLKSLPQNIVGVKRTENTAQLAQFYSMADVFANPTYVDNFPTTNIEALACGTPVVTYNTGGSPEAIDTQTGRVVPRGDIDNMLKAIRELAAEPDLRNKCRQRAVENFDCRNRFAEYGQLFKELCTTTH